MLNRSVLRLILLKLSVEILLFPLKWYLNLFTLKGMCVKIQKIIRKSELSCNMFQLATVGRRNHFHIFLSLTVNCENKLLKVYCVPRF